MEEKKIKMFEDKNLVEYRTDLEGWTGEDRLYYGKGDEGERRARYANSTHKKCECGGAAPKGWSYCEKCTDKKSQEKFDKLEQIDWDGKSIMCLRNDDKFFSSMEEVYEYCEDNDVRLKTLQLMLCEKEVHISEVNLDELNEEYCTEDESLSDFHPELAAKCEELNEMIRKTEPKIWFQTDKRIKI